MRTNPSGVGHCEPLRAFNPCASPLDYPFTEITTDFSSNRPKALFARFDRIVRIVPLIGGRDRKFHLMYTHAPLKFYFRVRRRDTIRDLRVSDVYIS